MIAMKTTWGKDGKQWENAAALSGMLSGILAAIPTPQTKGLAILLEFAAMIFGIAAPVAENPVSWILDCHNAGC